MQYIGTGELKRFVIHEQADDLAIGHVYYCLTGSGETVGFFGVNDRPLIIKSVNKRAVLHAGFSLFRAAAHAEIPVTQCQNGFRLLDKFRVKGLFNQIPLVGCVVIGWWLEAFMMKHCSYLIKSACSYRDLDRFQESSWPRSLTTLWAPCAFSSSTFPFLATPTTSPNPPCTAARTPEMA